LVDREEELAMYNRIIEWHDRQFACFLDRRSSFREQNTTLLHNSGLSTNRVFPTGMNVVKKTCPLSSRESLAENSPRDEYLSSDAAHRYLEFINRF